MNKVLLLALAGTVLLGATVFLVAHKKTSAVNDVPITEEVIAKWQEYKKTYGKKFSDPDMEVYRMEIFAQNLQAIKNDKTGTLGITEFSALSQEEFSATYLTLQVPEYTEATNTVSTAGDINWVTLNKVTAVKNQQQCGSCWAFSTTGVLESALIIAGKAEQSVDLSEQQLVSCSALQGNHGCNGGLMDNAFKYIKTAHITTESNYKYTATQTPCAKANIHAPLYGLTGFTDVKADTASLKAALQQQPIAIAVDATNWSQYKGGVFSNCGTQLNHGVLLVGFENGAWLVKNSWGPAWGESGYIRLADGNTCGLANVASFPTGVSN